MRGQAAWYAVEMHAEELHRLDLDVIDEPDEGVTISVQGELDTTTAPRLISTAHDLLDKARGSVELDCGGVWFLDSAGVRALIVVRNEALGMGMAFAIVRASDTVRRILDMTGLTSILTRSTN